jgi:II/X family phage/plasmid replication protein
MIDWVTAIIPCHHDEMIFGGFVTSVDLDGVIDWRVEKKYQVRGSHESNLNIKSIDNTHILLDGNPVKWLQGHNMFGTDDLIGLVQAVMFKLVPLLNLASTDYDFDAWAEGLYFLNILGN